MKKITGLSFAFVFILMMTACTNHSEVFNDFSLKGESTHWTGELQVHTEERYNKNDEKSTTYETSSKHTFVLEYKGELEDLKSLRHLKYKYQGTAIGGSEDQTFDTGSTDKRFVSTSSGNGAFETKNSVIEVTVEWDNQTETFTLKSTD
ncbi:hypothetical protein J2Z22_004727 [Paenibacillus forsythiae]|uniref:Lipoprotein n=1 Tax=Paenibacillus forsythiae TaxID=365616 RepID=A0ABU3HE85_9BACL|nr:hypothetical protein [Paenibacillus forsythiae]MDT3429127.1 hypothetical protein [Paenibacillus forsythiae]